MSDRFPAGPAARDSLEAFAGRHPDRVTVHADMDDFSTECFELFAKAHSDIAEGADPAAVERSVAAEVEQLKRRAVHAMRAAYAEALDRAIAGARAQGAHEQVAALAHERDPIFVLDLERDEMILSLHPALAPHADHIAAALTSA